MSRTRRFSRAPVDCHSYGMRYALSEPEEVQGWRDDHFRALDHSTRQRRARLARELEHRRCAEQTERKRDVASRFAEWQEDLLAGRDEYERELAELEYDDYERDRDIFAREDDRYDFDTGQGRYAALAPLGTRLRASSACCKAISAT